MSYLTIFKKLHDYIEDHNNTEFKILFNNHNFDPNPHEDLKYCKRTLLNASVYSDNFDIYEFLINHNKFDLYNITNLEWFERVIRRYDSEKIIKNTRYLDELLKLNQLLNIKCMRYINNLNLLEKLTNKLNMNDFDINDIFAIYNDKVQLYMLEYFMKNKIELFTKTFIENNLLHRILRDSNLSLLELLKKYKIDINMVKNQPIIINALLSTHILYTTTTRKINETINYFIKEKYYYDENLLDVKFYFNGKNGYYNLMSTMDFIIDNYDSIKVCFREVSDNDYALFNNFTSITYNCNFHIVSGIMSVKKYNFFIKLFRFLV